jgi:hypothetical protein
LKVQIEQRNAHAQTFKSTLGGITAAAAAVAVGGVDGAGESSEEGLLDTLLCGGSRISRGSSNSSGEKGLAYGRLGQDTQVLSLQHEAGRFYH